MSRVVPALLLAAALMAFVPHGAALFAVWLGTAAALLLALRAPDTRPSASHGLAALVVIVIATLVGAGVTWRGGASSGDQALEIFLLAAVATIWIPAGVYLATGEGGTPRALARIGVGLVLAWVALFGVVLAARIRGDGHILVLVLGAILLATALVWRIVRPISPGPRDAAPTP